MPAEHEFTIQAILNRCFDPTNNRLNIGVGAGIFYINDNSNADMTIGLTINQGANDNALLSFKSSDVAHGRTSQLETDTFVYFSKYSATEGGLFLEIARGNAGNTGIGPALGLRASVQVDNTAKTTAALAPYLFDSGLQSGTTIGNHGVNANLFVIRGGGTGRFIFDNEGSGHADVEWVAFAAHDDLAMVRDMEATLLARERPDQTYRRHALEEVGIIGKGSWHEEDGRLKAMVNFTKLAMLHHGALIQIAERFVLMEQRLQAIKGV